MRRADVQRHAPQVRRHAAHASAQARRLRLHPLVRVGLGAERFGGVRGGGSVQGWRRPNRVEPLRPGDDMSRSAPVRSIFDRFKRRRRPQWLFRVFRARRHKRRRVRACRVRHSARVRFAPSEVPAEQRRELARGEHGARRVVQAAPTSFRRRSVTSRGDVSERKGLFRDQRGGFPEYLRERARARARRGRRSRVPRVGAARTRRRPRRALRPPATRRRRRLSHRGSASVCKKSAAFLQNSRDVVSNLASSSVGASSRDVASSAAHALPPKNSASSTSGGVFARVSSRETVPSERRAPFASASLFTKSSATRATAQFVVDEVHDDGGQTRNGRGACHVSAARGVVLRRRARAGAAGSATHANARRNA